MASGWCPEFSTLRKIKEETLGEVKEKLDVDEDEPRNLFMLSATEDSPLEIELLEELCRSTTLEDVKLGRGRAGTQRVVWLDERNGCPDLKGTGEARQHENPLTATGLFRALEKPRFGHEDLPDAARRLIYIEDVDPACVQALAATVPPNQSRAVSNAIYQYLKFQASIAVNIPSTGFLTFQLDLHLPFFILRKSTPPKDFEGKAHLKPWRTWTDLSFLDLDKSDSRPQKPMEVWGIQAAQFSLVVAGSDRFRWNGYSFVDSEYDGILAESFDNDLPHDQIAAGVIEARFPYWTPRDYFIMVFEIRSRHVRNHWRHLIHKLELGIKQYINEHPSTLSHRFGNARERAAEMKKFEWARKTMDLLCQLDGVLCDTVEAWLSFNSADDDRAYFSDITPEAQRALRSIQKIFQQLQGSQRRLLLLKNYCSGFLSDLKLHLNLEATDAAVANGVTSEFTVAILYPIGLVAAFFSMQPGAIPFDLTPRSFAISVFILILMVYAIRLIGRHVQLSWPMLRNPIVLRPKRKVVDEDIGNLPELSLPTGIDLSRINDEERNDPRACGTRAVLGRQVARPHSPPG